MKKIILVIIGMVGCIIISTMSVSAEWYSIPFGGEVTVTGPDVDDSPILSNENPTNGSSGISLNPELYVDCSNDDGTNFDLYIRTNASDSWVTLQSFLNVGNNTGDFFDADTSNMNSYDTTYYFSVNVTDNHGGSGNWTNETYHFTTESEPSGTVTWYSSSFGGEVTVTESSEPGWSNWSAYWKIGQTSYTDTNTDMQVNYQDTGAVALEYGNSGDPGWIPEDVNDDGDVNYQDTGAVALDYGEDYE